MSFRGAASNARVWRTTEELRCIGTIEFFAGAHDSAGTRFSRTRSTASLLRRVIRPADEDRPASASYRSVSAINSLSLTIPPAISSPGSPKVLGFIGSAPTAQCAEDQTRQRGALSIKRLEGSRGAAAGWCYRYVGCQSRGLCILNGVDADRTAASRASAHPPSEE